MTLVCRRCARVNPAGARFCYHDGLPLDGQGSGGPIAVGAQPFLAPFVFPSGRTCRSFDELVIACEEDWDGGREVLKQGYLQGFFGGLGRADLARTARLAAQEPDLDSGLDQLLSQ